MPPILEFLFLTSWRPRKIISVTPSPEPSEAVRCWRIRVIFTLMVLIVNVVAI
jgi:hypothetical protein